MKRKSSKAGRCWRTLYFWETRKDYPAARYFAWFSLLAMAISAYLMFTFTFSPSVIRLIYLIVFLSIFGLVFFYCWGLDSKTKIRTPSPKQKHSFTRACVWMIVMGVLFQGLGNIVQAIYYWILGEQVTVYFSSQSNIFKLWVLVGLIYGFVYGIRNSNDYFNRDMGAVAGSIFSVFIFIFLYTGFVLALVIYPPQRLAPVSYYPQASEFLFYVLFFVAVTVSTFHFLRTAVRLGTLKTGLMLFIGIPLIALHIIVVSAYSVTINLTIASILEDRQKLSSAKTLYAKAIPFIRHDNLLASLHHRQGVLHVLNQDYQSAVVNFKKVLADYSENYEVFMKARRYVDAFEKNQSIKEHGRKILVVRHRTFEQAASCFPNSLSVILNFYEKQPLSTRKLSYAIKEGFSMGTFIWKAESFLEKNGYELLTTFWQSRKTLFSLLEAGYPVLVYIPGHVYTLYGYDSRMEMFFTYDTAKSNRWNDKPFWNFQRDWMRGSFLMSVVVPDGEKDKFSSLFPQFGRYSRHYQLWQKAHISDYYESKGNYWKDYDRYDLSKAFGIDRLKMNEPYFLHDDFYSFPWDVEEWKNDVLPVLSQPWALEWSIMEKYILYLLYSGQPERALHIIDLYQSHLPAEPRSRPPKPWGLRSRLSEDPNSSFFQLMELKLAAVVDANDEKGVLSVSDKLIGLTGNMRSRSYWGHYFKARHLMASGDLKGAVELLLTALDNLRLGTHPSSKSFRYIVDALHEIYLIDPSLIMPEKRALIQVAQIDLASDR
jgi:tetratricopeptide (TPR) repeat protein